MKRAAITLLLVFAASALFAQEPFPIIHRPLTSVTHDATLQGSGRPGDPLSVVGFATPTPFVPTSTPTDTPMGGTPTPTQTPVGGTPTPTATPTASPTPTATPSPISAEALGCVNPIAYGADPTFNTDSEPAFMLAQAAANVTGGSQCMNIPAGTYKLNFPLWIKGTTVNGSSTFRIRGAGGLSKSTFLRNNYVLVMPATGLSAADGGCGTGVLWTTPLAGAVGKSMCDNVSWWINLKQLLWNGTGSGDKPLNGKANLDAQFWFQADSTFNTGGSYIIRSQGTDGSVASTIGPLQIGYTWNGSVGQISAAMNIGGTIKTANTASIDLATASHFYEISYDGSDLRWFVDGTLSGTPTAATGTITDLPYTELGLGTGQEWPAGSAGTGFHGKVFGLRLSDVARNVADYTAPTTAFTSCDANTLVLLNGTKVYSDEGVTSTSGPFVQPECLLGGATNATYYYLMHSGALVSNLGTYISGVRIGQTQNSYGIVYNQANESMSDDLFILNINGVGLLEENNSYFSQYNNLNIATTWYDAQFLWPGQICTNCNFYVSDYPVLDNGGMTYNQSLTTPASNTRACLISIGARNPFTQEVLNQFQCDNEGQFTGSLFNFNGGNIQINGSALIGGNPAAIRIANGTNVSLNNDLVVGTATELVAAGFGAANPQTTSLVTYSSDYLQNFVLGIQNDLPPTDGQGEHYEMRGMGTKYLAATTSGSASVSALEFTDNYKSFIINLAAYDNDSSTAQKIMLPAGITALADATVSGTCTNVSTGAGSNTGCTSNSQPWPCCTGSGAGTCNTLLFVTLPDSMAATPQTGVCSAIGN